MSDTSSQHLYETGRAAVDRLVELYSERASRLMPPATLQRWTMSTLSILKSPFPFRLKKPS
jgi:hypothetical protein